MQQPQFEAVDERKGQVVGVLPDRCQQPVTLFADPGVEARHAYRRATETGLARPGAILDAGNDHDGAVVEIFVQALAAHVRRALPAVDGRRVGPVGDDRVHDAAERAPDTLGDAARSDAIG